MKIAVPTSDRKRVFERTGHATFFAVFTVEQSNISHIEFRENPKLVHAKGEHNHKEIIILLDDCDLLLLKKIGNHLLSDFMAAGFKYKITKADLIGEAIHQYLSA